MVIGAKVKSTKKPSENLSGLKIEVKGSEVQKSRTLPLSFGKVQA